MADKPAAPAADKGAAPAKKMNPNVEKLIKNQFWILGAIAIATAGTVWYLATGSLDAQFEKDKQITNMKFREMQALAMKQQVPNGLPSESFTAEVNKQKKKLGTQVVDAWTNLFERQTDKRSKGQIDYLRVNERMKDPFQKYGLFLLEPDDRAAMIKSVDGLESLVASKLNVYHNNPALQEDFEDLFKPLNLRHPKNRDVFGNEIAGQPGLGFDGLLVWGNRGLTPAKLRDRYKTTDRAPSLDRVAVTYEDIWTFRSMFSAIASVNSKPIDVWLDVMKGKPEGGENAPVDQANVPIKRIEFCDLAQYAMMSTFDDPGDVTIGADAANAAAQIAVNAGGGGGGFEVGTSGTEEETKLLLEKRYLDGRNAQVLDPSNPPYAEFRQMYVQLKVLMDQRLIPVLITECANAPLPIETRQVRISMETVDSIRKQAAVTGNAEVLQQSPHDAIVTVRGVVYIYTKPDEKDTPEEKQKLGKGSDPTPSKREYGIPKKGETAETTSF